MQYTNLIWDFDGMLFNTYPRMATAFQRALADFGVNEDYDQVMKRIKRSVGSSGKYYAAAFGFDSAALSDRYHEIEHGLSLDTIQPYEGMCEIIQDAANAGARQFLYTHRDHTALEALERHGLSGLFTHFITVNDPFPPKPAPDAIQSILTRFDVPAEKALMLGDRDIDVLAARNAGIEGALFDPDHFYDAFENRLRANTVEELRAVLGL